MGSLTWTLLPLTLLGGVPLPPSSYTIYIQRELHRLCKPASSWLCPKDMISLCDRLEFTKLFSSWTAVASASAVKEQQDNVVEMLEERMNKVQGQVDPWTSPLATVLRQKRDVPHSEKKGGNKSSPSASYSSQDTPTSKRGSRTTTAEENAVKRMSLTNSPDVKSFRNATAVSLDSQLVQELTSHASTHNFYFERLATAGKIEYQNGIPGNEFETAVLKQDITNEITDSTNSTATKTSDPSTQASNNTDFDGIAAVTYQYSSEPTDVSASRRWNPGGTPAELTTSGEALFLTINESVLFRRARNADSDVSDDQAKTLNTRQLVSNYSTSTEHDSSLTSAAYITDSASESFTHKNDHVTATPELLDEPVILTTQDLPVGTASPVNTVKPEEFTQTTLDEKIQVQTSTVANETGRKKPEVAPTMPSPEAYPSVNSVRVRLGLDARYNSCVRGREWQFREHIRRQLSVLLRVPLPGIRNVRVRPGSILVDADMVPVKTPTLELDKPALLAARRDLQERIDRGAVVVVDLDGNRLPIFTSTVYSLQPPHGTSYSPALLGALTAMFLAAASVIVASACLAKRHIGERHVSPSPERELDLEQPVEPQFLRLVSPSLLISTRLEDPASVTILRDTRMLPRRSLVPEPPVYKPARSDGHAPPVPPPPPVPGDEPSERLSAETWQSHPLDSPVAPSDSFSLEPWSTTPYQSRSEAEYGSDVTSRWTATPSGRWTSRSESFCEKTSARVPFSEKRVQNGRVK
ncbi:hypothetical protein V5799_002699 [Amblyomma americanum]|uniref:Uncharacterized protein n=1 Tax=Amblyomma americanum TaxID=6943 RepID=A0AAQ4DB27_AMBAM